MEKFIKTTAWLFCILGQITATEAFSKSDFVKEISCYKGLLGYSRGANFYLTNGAILLPSNSGKRGFYIFTEAKSYFHGFPAPSATIKNQNYYYLKLSVPDKKVLFMTYSDDPTNSANAAIGVGDEPASAIPGAKYVESVGVEDSTGLARKAFLEELGLKMKTVRATFESRSKVEEDEDEPAPKKPEAREFTSRLGVCRKIPELRKTADVEIGKLKRETLSVSKKSEDVKNK